MMQWVTEKKSLKADLLNKVSVQEVLQNAEMYILCAHMK